MSGRLGSAIDLLPDLPDKTPLAPDIWGVFLLIRKGKFMAESLPPVKLPRDTWVDLYASTGITVGVKLIVQNIGQSKANLTESLASPSSGVGFNVANPGEYSTNKTGNIGAWAYSYSGTKLQVEEA